MSFSREELLLQSFFGKTFKSILTRSPSTHQVAELIGLKFKIFPLEVSKPKTFPTDRRLASDGRDRIKPNSFPPKTIRRRRKFNAKPPRSSMYEFSWSESTNFFAERDESCELWVTSRAVDLISWLCTNKQTNLLLHELSHYRDPSHPSTRRHCTEPRENGSLHFDPKPEHMHLAKLLYNLTSKAVFVQTALSSSSSSLSPSSVCKRRSSGHGEARRELKF